MLKRKKTIKNDGTVAGNRLTVAGYRLPVAGEYRFQGLGPSDLLSSALPFPETGNWQPGTQ
ncbi:hypothetical protein FAM09_27960 [Niastella caeni]|uniref:Uncharacterized protein n=1 Tax=Niastella caeni TaxID=2569763 RepID=A0A4S8HB89_9BACT|nr:hypothetical protein [Niastella caeni]THU32023.1 hypothetical protein FAM09_27960 [Niastella caeni]